jgi:hypothetical protein
MGTMIASVSTTFRSSLEDNADAFDRGLRTYVTYGDLTGTVAADQHSDSGLAALAAAHGIDRERYLIFGVALSLGRVRPGRASVDFLAVDRQSTGCTGIDSVRDYLDFNGGALPYVQLPVEVPLEEFLACFKRLSIVFRNRALDGLVSRYAEVPAEDEFEDGFAPGDDE